MRAFLTGLYGNDSTRARIGSSILNGCMPHAFIIDGYDGSGKLTLATEIAAALNCENKHNDNTSLPCRSCPTCQKILKMGHVDVQLILREDGKQIMSVDKARYIRRDMFMSPTEAEYKVYIMRDAERMNVEAQNALLIALEEPPPNVVIILLCSGTDKILTTIKSRAQYIAMERFSPEDIDGYLKKNMPEARGIELSDKDGYSLALMGADGRIGLAKKLVMPKERAELISKREDTLTILRATSGASYTELMEAISLLPTDRFGLSLALEDLMVALRDMIAIYYSEDVELSFFLSYDEASELAYRIGKSRLYKLYDIILASHDDLSKNANVNALVSLLLAKIKTVN